ncbi:GT2 family glycosyltransferase [Pelomonas saccharophila]|uniref:GT2 family glycosyltransferase n=1 Tax=Roseateles saccharophilus TaxID=304 RepID=A0ABU1YU96_ROSSA|nr:glycosyltransferase family 2 protein [Roseateles saccharophilus]MDR7272415.1 GT2 family glycosyltransferase [Roseateles saccharophilus]
MKVAVVIVSYNGAAWIAGALQSLRESSHACSAIVVDNASSDDTAAIVRRDFPEARLIEAGANLGFGRGNNLGIEAALRDGAEAVFLLNQDAWVTSEAIAQMVAFLAAEPGFDIVSPLHCSPDLGRVDPNTQSAYLQRHASAYLSDACLGRVQPHYAIRGINAAAWMLRAEVFRRVGGFDPLFFMYGEDDDLIERFAHHGLRTALLPAARIVHLRAKAPQPPQAWGQQIAGRAERKRSALLLELKRPGGSLPGQLLRLLAAGVVQPLAELLANHDLKAFLAGLLASLRVLAEIARIRRHARLCAVPGAHFLNLDTP